MRNRIINSWEKRHLVDWSTWKDRIGDALLHFALTVVSRTCF